LVLSTSGLESLPDLLPTGEEANKAENEYVGHVAAKEISHR